MTTAIGLPLAMTIHAGIERSLGRSVDAADAAQGIDYDWMREFAAGATGVATTFRPAIIGFSATLDNVSAYLDGVRRPAAVAGAAGLYVLAWIFVSGGIIGRYARLTSSRSTERAASAGRFLSDCAAFFFRFFRLALVTAFAYGVLFGALHPLLFSRVYPRLTAGVDAEPAAFAIRVALYAIFVLCLAAANVVFDFAKVRTVVDDRRSVAVAIGAAWRFIRRHPAGALGVYLLDVMLFAIVIGGYAIVAPPGGGIGKMAWAAFVIGQAYIVGRLLVRLVFFASETAVYRLVTGDRRLETTASTM